MKKNRELLRLEERLTKKEKYWNGWIIGIDWIKRGKKEKEWLEQEFYIVGYIILYSCPTIFMWLP